jgi:hypothetical protein
MCRDGPEEAVPELVGQAAAVLQANGLAAVALEARSRAPAVLVEVSHPAAAVAPEVPRPAVVVLEASHLAAGNPTLTPVL